MRCALVLLVYESGGCRRGDGRATVHETRSRIRISVDEGEVVGPDVVCPLVLTYRTLRVSLRRAVAGRRIVGGPRIRAGIINRHVEVDGTLFPLVPRVIDLAYEDARAVLRAQQFQVRRFGQRRGRVTFQSPSPGRRARDGTVGLTLGRHAFHARALEHCLDGAGIPTVAGRPRTGDENAPNLELVLNHPQAGAFVALYADPSRAREYAPAIRRRIERGGGVLERLGRVSIAWVKPPAPALRDAVRGCVGGAKP